jgi:disulfide bond formation protein DsbB
MKQLLQRLPDSRWVHLAAVGVCIVALVSALALEYMADLAPCPLCLVQRAGVVLAGIFFLAAAVHNPRARGQRIYGGLAGLSALAGAGVSIRHLWLQQLPEDQVPACGPDLSYMLEVFPLWEVITTVFQGSGECADASWQFLGLTIPGWSLVIFVILLIVAVVQLTRPHA